MRLGDLEIQPLRVPPMLIGDALGGGGDGLV
jgi:hypothetical protein